MTSTTLPARHSTVSRLVMRSLALTAVAACAFAFAGQARANAIAYQLNTYYGTTPSTTGSYGTVTLTQDGANVDVSVSLATGVGFVDTSAGDSLMWDLMPTVTSPITIMNLSTGYSVVNGTYSSSDGSWSVSSNPNAYHGNASGYWNFAVTCASGVGDATPACKTGGSGPAATPPNLDFTITNLSLSDFTTNSDNNYFASDVCILIAAGGGCTSGSYTGVISGGPHNTVPEPGALALFAAGLGSLGFALSRKRRQAVRHR